MQGRHHSVRSDANVSANQWTYGSVGQQVVPGVQLRVDVLQVPSERFTLQPFSQAPPLCHVPDVNAVILQSGEMLRP